MWSTNRQLSKSLLFVVVVLLLLVLIAGGADTLAAPSSQGTVPTRSIQTPGGPPPPAGTSASTSPGGPNGSGGSPNPQGANPTPGLSPFTCAVGGGDLYCTSGGGDFTFYFPLGSVPAGTRATIAPVVDCPSPIIPPEYTFLGPCYDVTVIGPDGKPITVFNPPLKLTVSFTQEDVAKAGGDANRLYILFYDVPSGLWTTKDLGDRSVDTAKQQVSVTVPHFTTYALFFQNGTSGSGGQGSFLDSLLEFLRRFIGSGQ
jgi:hypothetical protein